MMSKIYNMSTKNGFISCLGLLFKFLQTKSKLGGIKSNQHCIAILLPGLTSPLIVTSALITHPSELANEIDMLES